MTPTYKLGAILLIIVIAVVGCTRYRSGPIDEYRARHGWGLPVDTLGPYMITARFAIKEPDDSVSSGDSVSIVGVLKGDVCRKRLETTEMGKIPRLTVDSVCLVTTQPEHSGCFSVSTSPATYDSIAEYLYAGPRSTLSGVSLSKGTLLLQYSYTLSLFDPEAGSLLEHQTFSHQLSRSGSPIGNSLRIESLYPSPFCPTTRFGYLVDDTCAVTLVIYNILGKVVDTLVNEEQPPGYYDVEWAADGLTSGIYFYRLSACGFVETKKAVLLK